MAIERPSATALLQAEINRLNLLLRATQAQLVDANSATVTAQAATAELAEDVICPDCEDVDALQCAADGLNYDVLKVQSRLRNELCGNHWRNTFSKCSASEAFGDLRTMFDALLRFKEYELAVAGHNLAFCKSEGAEQCVADTISVLEAYIVAHPDLDARCKAYIEELLVVARA